MLSMVNDLSEDIDLFCTSIILQCLFKNFCLEVVVQTFIRLKKTFKVNNKTLLHLRQSYLLCDCHKIHIMFNYKLL